MKIKLIEKRSYEIEVSHQDTILDIVTRHGLKVNLAQIGGPLGQFVKGYDLNKGLDEFTLYENNIMVLDEFCPVDLSRFMIRFLIRELDIKSSSMRRLYEMIDNMTSHGEVDFEYFEQLIQRPYESLGENLLVQNLQWLIKSYGPIFKEHLNGYCRASICRGLFEAQCINACPAHIHIPGFIALMKDKDYETAYKLMRQENPLSSVCGSVCARPCEARCRRGEITGTVGVRALQRFISSEALRSWQGDESVFENNGFSVGIIGGGPAGLTAAYYLVRTGYDVTIYESHSEAGGMLASGVPKYRLPSHLIREEIKTIENLGVKILTDYKINQENYLSIKDTHDRIIIATGTPKGKIIDIDHPHVLSGIDFLKSLDDKMNLGNHVLVIGGGDVALDCARSARRLKADVTVMSLEAYDEMPASLEEKVQSREEGVVFKCGYALDHIDGDTISLKKCLTVFDEARNFNPKFEKTHEFLQAVDTVIFAIGQERDVPFIDESITGNKLDDKVYLAGDVIRPTIVIDAIAQGKLAAQAIDKDLIGRGLNIGDPIVIPEKILNIRTFDDDLKEIATTSVEERLLSFDQVNQNYTEEDAAYEAERCMRCDRNSRASLLLGR